MAEEITTITTPIDPEQLASLNAGDRVLLSGEIFVFRDQVHKLLLELIAKGEPMPFDLTNAALYYCGPTPAKNGMAVGSAGPTTSSRMDDFTEPLLARGLKVTIGKGDRSEEVAEAYAHHGAAYFVAVGGAGALLARTIENARVIAWPELGPEAARVFTVRSMPLIVGIDSVGESAFFRAK